MKITEGNHLARYAIHSPLKLKKNEQVITKGKATNTEHNKLHAS